MAYFDEEEEYKQPFSLAIWKKLFPFIKPYKKNMATITIFMLISAVIDIFYPLFQRYAIDNFILKNTTKGVFLFSIIYIVLLLSQIFCVITFIRSSMFVEMNVGKDLKKSAFVHLQKLSFSYYNVTPVGYMMARVMSDTSRIGGMLAWGLVDALWAFSYVTGVFIVMLIMNWKIALLVMTVVPFIAIATVYFQKKILNVNRKIRKINSTMTGAFNEGITGARTSKTLVIEDKNTADFAVITNNLYKSTIRATRLNALFIPIVMFFSTLSVAFVISKGGYMVMDGIIELGMLSAFITYAVSIFEPIQQLARVIADFIATQANIERVTGLLETKPTITDRDDVIKKYGDTFTPKHENWEKLNGDIEFKDVWFKYPDGDEYILTDFNLKIPAGTTVAIVGETGAGKSTLVNLACRFFEPTQGSILIDNVDYRERSQLWLHSNIGYVLQNPHLFSGSINDNIRFGRLDATDEEIVEACKIVSAHEIIEAMENGYDSNVGEGGDRLSTGEKQLISFARAVLANPRIFILDEATSSIDTKTEQKIQYAISKLLNNRTSFLIAHRLSTIRKADLILVVKNGKIIEQGTHEELLRKQGYYFTLYKNQYEQEAEEKIFVEA
ncbi:MAG: ABC transporter ATP-binding protein [Oscillospiraceae bacterium]